MGFVLFCVSFDANCDLIFPRTPFDWRRSIAICENQPMFRTETRERKAKETK